MLLTEFHGESLRIITLIHLNLLDSTCFIWSIRIHLDYDQWFADATFVFFTQSAQTHPTFGIDNLLCLLIVFK